MEWRVLVKKTCPRHDDQQMVIEKYHDNTPKRQGDRIRVKCAVPTCGETSTVSQAEAQADLD